MPYPDMPLIKHAFIQTEGNDFKKKETKVLIFAKLAKIECLTIWDKKCMRETRNTIKYLADLVITILSNKMTYYFNSV